MVTATTPETTFADLQSALVHADSAAVLLPARIVRRLLRMLSPGSFRLGQVQGRPHVMTKQQLLQNIVADELLGRSLRSIPSEVIVLCTPGPALKQLPHDRVLYQYWRMLFQGRVQLSLLQQSLLHSDPAFVQRRIEVLGRGAFHEVQHVLQREHYWQPDQGDAAAWVHLSALWLTCHYFAPNWEEVYFPALAGREDLVEVFHQDVDVDELFQQTCPSGMDTVQAKIIRDSSDTFVVAGKPSPLSNTARRNLLQRAESAKTRGNNVRAAILYAKLARDDQNDDADAHSRSAVESMEDLCQRLHSALDIPDDEQPDWRDVLSALLDSATRGFWPNAARLLYDLQKVCVDFHRGLTRIDLPGWLLSLGRKSLQAPMPLLKGIFVTQHLRSAYRRVPKLETAGDIKEQLRLILEKAIHREEKKVRARFRPVLEEALNEVDLRPANFVEEMARDKLCEELLDHIVEGGMLTMGEVRDAIARNQIKLKDLSGPVEFFRGDKLLRLNAVLPRSLSGVYQRGEFYLRWLQSVNSLLFGTRLGRFLTRYALLPFVGSAVILMGIYFTWKEIDHFARLHMEPPEILASGWAIGAFGVVLLLLMHWAKFRHQVFQSVKVVATGVRVVFHDAPLWVVRLPSLRLFLQSPFGVFGQRFLFKPFLLLGVVTAVLYLCRLPWEVIGVTCSIVFLLTATFFATRWSTTFDEWLSERLIHTWHRVSLDFFPALFRFIMDLFKWVVGQIERFLYSVDQWLRFQHKQQSSPLTLIGKGLIIAVWSVFAYLVRVLVILVFEPQINPIKHFPVVTVSAKLVVPLYLTLQGYIAEQTTGWNQWLLSAGNLFGVQLAFPGLCGFLVWELRESWRLYEANRPDNLQPVIIGSHGETMRQLLQPGFHSGTLPKIHAKLRRAMRREDSITIQKCHEQLHHVSHALDHFVERELLHLIQSSPGGKDMPLHLSHTASGATGIHSSIHHSEHSNIPLVVRIDLRAGWLVMQLLSRGWLDHIALDQKKLFTAAFLGLAKRAGIQLLDEQIRVAFAKSLHAYDIHDDSLLVWPQPDYRTTRRFPLEAGDAVIIYTGEKAPLPRRKEVIFSENPLAWDKWVHAWEQHNLGKKMSLPLAKDVYVYGKISKRSSQ